jgi:hypothetical protein
VATGNLTVANIAVDAAVRVIGHVHPFGQALADFDARTVVDVSVVTP